MADSSPSVLCVTRTFPPVVGGMERLSAEFTTALSEKTRVELVANRYGKKALPLFIPWAAWKVRQLAPRVDVVHLGDPSLLVLLPFLSSHRQEKRPPAPDISRTGVDRPSGHGVPPEAGRAREEVAASEPRWGERAAVSRDIGAESGRTPVALTIHGLDILYPFAPYQAMLRRFLPRVDLALCISRYVEEEFSKRFPRVRTQVMLPCLAQSFRQPRARRQELREALRLSIGDGPLLLAVARLVRRKGIAWFVENVLPALPEAQLLVIGSGPEHAAILSAAERAGVGPRVLLAGNASREKLALAYSTADLLVMPNIVVPGDAEGFGLVALEAASAGLPVVASDLEGIRDAVVPDETGVFAPPLKGPRWVEIIQALLRRPEQRHQLAARAPGIVQQKFSWDTRSNEILDAFQSLTRRTG